MKKIIENMKNTERKTTWGFLIEISLFNLLIHLMGTLMSIIYHPILGFLVDLMLTWILITWIFRKLGY